MNVSRETLTVEQLIDEMENRLEVAADDNNRLQMRCLIIALQEINTTFENLLDKDLLI